MAKGDQARNGKAFEYALALVYTEQLHSRGLNVALKDNRASGIARGFFESFADAERQKYKEAAIQTLDTMLRLEPGLHAQKNVEDVLYVCLNDDSEGEDGDVRDVVFSRQSPRWEIGFSAKNNNDAVKHSRLSSVLDFGQSWVGVPCSDEYWNDIAPVFDFLEKVHSTKVNHR